MRPKEPNQDGNMLPEQTFTVSIDRSAGGLLGFDFTAATLEVASVRAHSLVASWNLSNPQASVLAGDEILEVNGQRNADQILTELARDSFLCIVLCRSASKYTSERQLRKKVTFEENQRQDRERRTSDSGSVTDSIGAPLPTDGLCVEGTGGTESPTNTPAWASAIVRRVQDEGQVVVAELTTLMNQAVTCLNTRIDDVQRSAQSAAVSYVNERLDDVQRELQSAAVYCVNERIDDVQHSLERAAVNASEAQWEQVKSDLSVQLEEASKQLEGASKQASSLGVRLDDVQRLIRSTVDTAVANECEVRLESLENNLSTKLEARLKSLEAHLSTKVEEAQLESNLSTKLEEAANNQANQAAEQTAEALRGMKAHIATLDRDFQQRLRCIDESFGTLQERVAEQGSEVLACCEREVRDCCNRQDRMREELFQAASLRPQGALSEVRQQVKQQQEKPQLQQEKPQGQLQYNTLHRLRQQRQQQLANLKEYSQKKDFEPPSPSSSVASSTSKASGVRLESHSSSPHKAELEHSYVLRPRSHGSMQSDGGTTPKVNFALGDGATTPRPPLAMVHRSPQPLSSVIRQSQSQQQQPHQQQQQQQQAPAQSGTSQEETPVLQSGQEELPSSQPGLVAQTSSAVAKPLKRAASHKRCPTVPLLL